MTKIAARVKVKVRDADQWAQRFAATLAGRGMFVQSDTPPPLNSSVEVIFLDHTGATLSTLMGRVVHARPALTPGESTAGMGLQFDQLDAAAQRLVDAFKAQGGRSQVGQEGGSEGVRVEHLSASEESSGRQGPILGIDLGTTQCCVAVLHNGEPRVLTDQGHEIFPSVIFVGADKQVLVGHKAVERMVVEPGRGIYGSKRFIGRPFASREVGTYGHFVGYALAEGRQGMVAAKVGGLVVPLETVAAYILSHIKGIAKRELGQAVERAVITVPAYFSESQRRAVQRAGELAHLTVERIVSEPTAAAVAYGFGRGLQRTVLIYDLGGGTFDATVLTVKGDRMEVLATDGDPFLGGADFDDRLTEYILMNLERRHNVGLRRDPVAVQRVRLAAEAAKKTLSEAGAAAIHLPHLAPNLTAELTLGVDQLRALTEDLVHRTLNIVERVLHAAKLKSEQIDDVIMVGGQSRSPLIRQMLRERFGKEPARGVHPDHAVAIGAALVAGMISRAHPLQLRDVLPSSLRRVLAGGTTEVIFPRGTPIPAEAELALISQQQDDKVEFKLTLVSGEHESADKNTQLGEVRLPSSLALAFAKSQAKVKLEVSAEGTLQVTATHPITGEVSTLRVALADNPPAGEMLSEVK